MPISISQYLEYYTVGENFTKLQFIKSHYKQKKKIKTKRLFITTANLIIFQKYVGIFYQDEWKEVNELLKYPTI
jgi:hypothetical protein